MCAVEAMGKFLWRGASRIEKLKDIVLVADRIHRRISAFVEAVTSSVRLHPNHAKLHESIAFIVNDKLRARLVLLDKREDSIGISDI